MSDLSARFHKLTHVYRRSLGRHGLFFGHVYFVSLVLRKILGRMLGYDTLDLYRKPVAPEEPSPADTAGVQFGEAREADLASIVALRSPNQAAVVSERLRNGETCYVARVPGSGLIGCLWAAPGDRVFPHRSREIHISEGDVYIRDVFVLREYRGKGLAPKLTLWAGNQLSRKGFHTMWTAIKGYNYSSKRAMKKAGYLLAERTYFARSPFTNKEHTFTREWR